MDKPCASSGGETPGGASDGGRRPCPGSQLPRSRQRPVPGGFDAGDEASASCRTAVPPPAGEGVGLCFRRAPGDSRRPHPRAGGMAVHPRFLVGRLPQSALSLRWSLRAEEGDPLHEGSGPFAEFGERRVLPVCSSRMLRDRAGTTGAGTNRQGPVPTTVSLRDPASKRCRGMRHRDEATSGAAGRRRLGPWVAPAP